MATYDAYGSWCATDDYRAHAYVSVTTGDTAYTFTVQCRVNALYGWASNLTTNGTAKVGSASASGSVSSFSAGDDKTIVTKSNVSVARGHSAQTVRCQAVVSGYAGTSTATKDVTVPALASYAVSYDANGGSGAPAGQTKWHGEALTLSSATPTRPYYNFMGWADTQAKASAGTVDYQAGGSYTGNVGVTLYAVWELALVLPTLSDVHMYRVPTVGTVYDDFGTNGYVSFCWEVSADNGNTASTTSAVTVKYREVGASSWTDANSATVTGLGGGGAAWAGKIASGGSNVTLDTAKSYEVMVTLTDHAGAAMAVMMTISRSFLAIDYYNAPDGSVRSLAFGRAASESVSEIGFASELAPVFDDAMAWKQSLGTCKPTPIFTGLTNVGSGDVMGTSTEVFRYRLFYAHFSGSEDNWCLCWRTGDENSAGKIRGVGAYDSGSQSYLFKVNIAVATDGECTLTVASQHGLSSGLPGTILTIDALYGIC